MQVWLWRWKEQAIFPKNCDAMNIFSMGLGFDSSEQKSTLGYMVNIFLNIQRSLMKKCCAYCIVYLLDLWLINL